MTNLFKHYRFSGRRRDLRAIYPPSLRGPDTRSSLTSFVSIRKHWLVQPRPSKLTTSSPWPASRAFLHTRAQWLGRHTPSAGQPTVGLQVTRQGLSSLSLPRASRLFPPTLALQPLPSRARLAPIRCRQAQAACRWLDDWDEVDRITDTCHHCGGCIQDVRSRPARPPSSRRPPRSRSTTGDRPAAWRVVRVENGAPGEAGRG